MQTPAFRYPAVSLSPLLITCGIIHAFGIGIPSSTPCEPSRVEGNSEHGVPHQAGATVLSQNQFPSLGQVGVYYFDGIDQSQVWINLEPEGMEEGPNPFRLNITVSFTGVKLDRAPDAVDVRAETVGGAFPTRMRKPILRFRYGESTEVDLSSTGKKFQFFSSCPDCTLDTVVAPMSFDAMRQAAQSSTVAIDALGFTARLKPADIQSLRKFVDIVGHGIFIKQ